MKLCALLISKALSHCRFSAVFALIMFCLPAFVYAEESAGKVSFVIGEAYIAKQGKAFTKITVGSAITEGDQVKTLGDGHVHIRFIDGGLASVRPNSDFIIKHYQYDQNEPKNSVVRFDLTKGVARSISGKAAKAARDKFRMNTPIAAIGVRGTDFVVSAKTDSVRAIVNEGAIVLAPFSEGCIAESVGPCELNSVELTGLTDQLLEFTSASLQPRLIPRNTHVTEEFGTDSLELEAGGVENSTTENSDSLDDETAEDTDSTASFDVNDSEDQSRDQVDQLATEDKLKSLESVKANYVPDVALTADQLNERQLVWGRWSDTTQATDKIVVNSTLVAEGRHITVGNLHYGLYRTGSIYNGLASNLGKVNFSLVDAQAILKTSSVTSEMEVKNGWLEIDFDADEFKTGLDLYSVKTSSVAVNASGTINSKGYFLSNGSDHNLRGATSLDGSEASYLFVKQHELGEIEGITFWENQ